MNLKDKVTRALISTDHFLQHESVHNFGAWYFLESDNDVLDLPILK